MNGIIFLNFIIMLAVTFFMRTTTNMLMTTIPVLSKFVINASVLQVGIAATLYSIGALFSGLFINGRVSTRNTPRVLSISLLIMSLTTPFFYFSVNMMEVYILSIIDGISFGTMMPLMLTLVNILSDQGNKDRAIALYTSSLSLSLIFGTLFEGSILSYLKISIRDIFLLFTLLSILATILMFILLYNLHIEKKIEKIIKFRDLINKIPDLFKNKDFNLALTGNLSYSFPFIIILTYGSIIGKNYSSISPSVFFYLLGVFFVVSFITRVCMVIMSPINNKKLLFIASFILTLTGYVVFSISSSELYFIIAFIMLGIPHGSIYPLSTTYISGSINKEDLNMAYSIFGLVGNMIFFVTPFLFGVFTHMVNIRFAVYSFLLPMLILMILSITYIYRRK